MYTARIIKKVPGNIPPEPRKEKQGYIGDLSQKTIPQLNELLERQVKLLSNKAFINNLADKGEKIKKLKDTIEEELKKRNESENLSKMLAIMSLNGKEDLDALEWDGHHVHKHTVLKDDSDMSDDDEKNPLKILATHSGTGFHKKKHKIIKPEKSLIVSSDLITNDSDKESEGEILEEYARQLCEKLDSVKTSCAPKSKFLPHKSLKQSTLEKKESKKPSAQWEVTAATPPPPVHGDTKLVSLQESIKLQCEQQQKLKEIQMKHAAERLAVSQKYSLGHLPCVVGSYRETASQSSSDDEQNEHEHEVLDEEYPDGGGVVVYNLVDDISND